MKSLKISYQMRWVQSSKIKKTHQDLKITQVYCWLYARDKKIILVSKGDQKWQFPGGHPRKDEPLKEALVREVFEETSLDIKPFIKQLAFFGYYLVSEIIQDKIARQYLQVRFLLKLPPLSNELELSPQERKDEKAEDKIQKSKCFTLKEAIKVVPWLGTSKELRSFNRATL